MWGDDLVRATVAEISLKSFVWTVSAIGMKRTTYLKTATNIPTSLKDWTTLVSIGYRSVCHPITLWFVSSNVLCEMNFS